MSLVLCGALAAAGAETPPVTLSCATSSDFSKWRTINATYRGWEYSTSKSAAESYSSSSTENDYWLISQPVTLLAGVKYEITYNVASDRATADFV